MSDGHRSIQNVHPNPSQSSRGPGSSVSAVHHAGLKSTKKKALGCGRPSQPMPRQGSVSISDNRQVVRVLELR